jgi:8-oxo-dGTP pyrophosphatase MutT (NUDIX family)
LNQFEKEHDILFENPFLQLRNTPDGYTYVHEIRCEGQIVALLPFRCKMDKSGLEYLARREVCPAHGREPELYSITGGKEAELTLEATACRELLEEGGFTITRNELIPLGIVKPSKAMDTLASLFAVDVTGKEQTEPQGDGSYFEQGSSVEWVGYEEGVSIEDPLFITALTRLHTRQNL